MMKVACYSDNGEALPCTNEAGELLMMLPRFGVWATSWTNGIECIDTGDDLAALREQYGHAPLMDISWNLIDERNEQ